ncbi:DnaJ domain-containing protein [Haloarcula marina]|uniref:DnaJ domain-containing protein n=1 Tax=Haloarcula marina TaxID=2961574 RepID=UPI0020B87EFD|nr:DnaJ domain-containing protein [Halomicroarcula marina]
MSETFYDVLGVDDDASRSEIEAAYRERLKETHPDVSDASDAEAATKRLIEARDVLVDADERARYDRLGHDAYVGDDSSGSRVASAAREAGYGDAERRADDDASGHSASRSRRRTADRARRERRASERVRDDRASRESGVETETDADARAASAANERTTATGEERVSVGTGTHNTAGSPAWASGRGYRVRQTVHTGPDYDSLVPSGRELSLLGITFALYPVLLFSALMPPFPLYLNLIVAFCAVVVVGYLQSMPRVALLVFGTWSLLTPLVLAVLGVGFLSLVGFVALCGTWLPFGFSILTAVVLRL